MDFLILIATVTWFAMLFLWPFAVLLSSIGWLIAAVKLSRRGKTIIAFECALLGLVVLSDGAHVIANFDLQAALPSQSRPMAQLIIITLPWLSLLLGAIILVLRAYTSHNERPNLTFERDCREAARDSPST
ncbi:MAG: hypothetical protein WAT12_07100 [Candidatus Nitrotoga sp.]